jgi:hypothetical protein
LLNDLTILISALPVLGETHTVNKSERVKLQIKQDINDIKETKWFMRDIDGNLISIQNLPLVTCSRSLVTAIL